MNILQLVHTSVQVVQAHIQSRLVLPPRHPVHARGRVPLQCVIGYPYEFLLPSLLGSADSAVACASLFAGLAATMPMSDSFGSFIFGPASRLSSAVPATTRRDDPKASQVPVYDVRTCQSSSTPCSPARSHHNDPSSVAFDLLQGLGTPHVIFFDAP